MPPQQKGYKKDCAFLYSEMGTEKIQSLIDKLSEEKQRRKHLSRCRVRILLKHAKQNLFLSIGILERPS